MKRVGILAYGSLRNNHGKEITESIDHQIMVGTTFKIEFAHRSRTRDYAPTLIPVRRGGAKNRAQILVLKEGVTARKARNMLWRREAHKEKGQYRKKFCRSRNNRVCIKSKTKFLGVDVVLYTKLKQN